MPVISIINDEISDNIREMVAFLKERKLKKLEIRSFGKKNIANIAFPVLRRYAAYLKKNQLQVSALASPLLKWDRAGRKSGGKNILNSHYYQLENSSYEKFFQIADIFQTKYIRIFSFLRYPGFKLADLDEVIAELLVLAKRYDKVLLIENEPVCNIRDCQGLAGFAARFCSPRLKILLDPGNLYHEGDNLDYSVLAPYKDLIAYVHVKDFSPERSGYVPLGEGAINYKRFISWLGSEPGVRPVFSLETHVAPERRREGTAASLGRLRELFDPRRLRYGIIGCGRVSKKHATAIKDCPGAELAGLYDLVPEKGEQAARLYDTRQYKSMREIIRDVDVVSICTPHHTHAALISEVLKQDKFCLCEKPGSISQKDMALVRRHKNYKKKLFVVYQNRYNEPILRLSDIVKKKRLGRVIYISGSVRWFRPHSYYLRSWQGNRDKEGGILFNQGAHIMDIIMNLLPDQTAPVIMNVIRDRVYHKNIKTEDILLAQFKSANTLVNIEITAAALPDNLSSSLLVVMEKGRALVGGKALEAALDVDSLDRKETLHYQLPSSSDVYGVGHKMLIRHLTAYARTGQRDLNLVDFDTACRRIELIAALYKKAAK